MMPIVHLMASCVCVSVCLFVSTAWVQRESHYNLDTPPAIYCGQFSSVVESLATVLNSLHFCC